MNAHKERERVIRLLFKKALPQQGLLDPTRFQNFVSERGLSIQRGDLETWDRLGILHPIIKIRCPFTYHHITGRLPDGTVQYHPQPLDREPHEGQDVIKLYDMWSFGPEELRKWQEREEELVICPSVDTFQPWSELMEKDAQAPGALLETVGIFYHPYQIFRLREVHRLCNTTFRWPAFTVEHSDWGQWEDWQRKGLDVALNDLKASEVVVLRRLAMLLLIEDRYLPKVRDHITYYGWRPEWLDDWYQWAEAFRPGEVLQESGLTVEEVKKIRRDFAAQGNHIDPNDAWYHLIRHITYKQRRRLKGDALLAWDYYEVAEMLGRFLEDVTGERQPHVDDLVSGLGGEWKKSIYGVAPEDFDYHKRTALPAIVRQFGLDPRIRVLFVIEGESEAAFVERWCEQKVIDLRALGVRLVPLGGGELKSRRTRQYLCDAREEGAPVLVALDAEQDYPEQLNKWAGDGLIEKVFEVSELNNSQVVPIGGMLWKPCFEDANFTFEELLEAWITTIDAKRPGRAMDKEKVQSAVQVAHNSQTDITWIKSMEEASRQLRLPFSKPEIAKELADRFSDSNKPIILLLLKVIQLGLRSRTARYQPIRNGVASG